MVKKLPGGVFWQAGKRSLKGTQTRPIEVLEHAFHPVSTPVRRLTGAGTVMNSLAVHAGHESCLQRFGAVLGLLGRRHCRETRVWFQKLLETPNRHDP